MERTARCQCGQASLTVVGEPSLISACCCTRCQRRSGSVFAVASRWPVAQVIDRQGATSTFRRQGATGGQVTLSFCPTCGSTVMTELEAMPGVIGIPVGAFADPQFPPPQVAVWCEQQAAWVRFPNGTVTLADQSRPMAPD